MMATNCRRSSFLRILVYVYRFAVNEYVFGIAAGSGASYCASDRPSSSPYPYTYPSSFTKPHHLVYAYGYVYRFAVNATDRMGEKAVVGRF